MVKKNLYRKIVDHVIENQDNYYRLAYSYVRNQEDALDAVQNAVCKALEHYGDLKNENAVRTWFYKIVVNESLQIIKERKKYETQERGVADDTYEEPGFEIQDDIYQQINRLDEETQTIIKLRFFEDLTLKEISEVMEMNLNTTKAKLYRGLQSLKIYLKEEAG